MAIITKQMDKDFRAYELFLADLFKYGKCEPCNFAKSWESHKRLSFCHDCFYGFADALIHPTRPTEVINLYKKEGNQ